MNDWINRDGKIIGAVIDGKEKTFYQLMEISGIKDQTIRSRAAAGWTLEQALTLPPARARKVARQAILVEAEEQRKRSRVASMRWVVA